jgi:predicted outer membrane repeat protein
MAVAFALLVGLSAAPTVGAAGPTKCQVSNERTRVGSGSLQAAVDAAAPGDTITIRGTCIGSTTIDRSLTLKGGKTNRAFGTPTLDGGGVGRVLFVDYFDPSRAGFTLTIESLTITDGFGEDGNGGGGLLIQGGTVVIKDSVITRNSSGVLAGGGIQVGGGSLRLLNATVSDNTAGDGGGGIFAAGSLTIDGSTISGNSAQRGSGGGVDFVGGTLSVSDSVLIGNDAYAGGGALDNHAGSVTLTRVTVSGNSAISGAGVQNASWDPAPPSAMTIVDSTISDNSASLTSGEGGGIANRGILTIADSTIQGNSSRFGGGVSNFWGTVTAEDSTIRDNTASVSGGGIGTGIGDFTLHSSVVSGNSATVGGGGVLVGASLIDEPSVMTISDSTISDNAAANGGGVSDFGSLTFATPASIIGGNRATTRGGGVLQDSTYPVAPSIIGGCPVGQGGNVVYDPANSPTDYEGFTCGLPTPQLALRGTHDYTTGPDGPLFTSYDLTVTNWADYPAALFAPAPDLPPCGLNANASRAWVDIYHAGTDGRIYGFCALAEPSDLTQIWFAEPHGTPPPAGIYITITDRRTGQTVRSNSISLAMPT